MVSYTPVGPWTDNQPPAINATNLNKLEQGIIDLVAGTVLRAPRVSTLTAASNTYTPNTDTSDVVLAVSPTANFTFANPTGTPADEQRLLIKIKNGSSGYTPTWGSAYQSSGVATLPASALAASKTVTFGFIYDASATKWVLFASDTTGY